jgi:asparagine synthetase B (glutamine-hydrolysing)
VTPSEQSANLQALDQFEQVLSGAVERRVVNIPARANEPRLGILFSGGLDSTVLAALANRFLPLDEPIDLINVAFGNTQKEFDSAPDRITGRIAFDELQRVAPRPWRFVCADIPASQVAAVAPHIMTLIAPLNTVMDLTIASALWFAARHDRDFSIFC